jgi:hypothetical protein
MYDIAEYWHLNEQRQHVTNAADKLLQTSCCGADICTFTAVVSSINQSSSGGIGGR